MAAAKHTRARKAPSRPSPRPEPTIAEVMAKLTGTLTVARSVVSVTAQALNHGKTDLELQSADVLLPAADTLDEILCELLSLRWDEESIVEP